MMRWKSTKFDRWRSGFVKLNNLRQGHISFDGGNDVNGKSCDCDLLIFIVVVLVLVLLFFLLLIICTIVFLGSTSTFHPSTLRFEVVQSFAQFLTEFINCNVVIVDLIFIIFIIIIY